MAQMSSMNPALLVSCECDFGDLDGDTIADGEAAEILEKLELLQVQDDGFFDMDLRLQQTKLAYKGEIPRKGNE